MAAHLLEEHPPVEPCLGMVGVMRETGIIAGEGLLLPVDAVKADTALAEFDEKGKLEFINGLVQEVTGESSAADQGESRTEGRDPLPVPDPLKGP